MQYCDALDEEDLRTLEIGHLVVGGFYRRPDSLEPVIRSADEKLWFAAVGAFREALRLGMRLRVKDDFLMVKANLGVAYLVHPGGKDVGEAERWFDEVFTALRDPEKAKSLDPLVHASILINSGSARGFSEELVASTRKLLAKARTERGNGAAVQAMESALQLNQAMAARTNNSPENNSSDGQKNALKMFENYLDGMTSASSWWPIAYDQYVQLAKASGVTPKDKSEFRKPGIKDWRAMTGVTLPDGKQIGLSESLTTVLKTLGPADVEIPVMEGTNLKYYKYKERGITILATREVLAIILDSPAAPTLTIRRPGLGGDEATVSVGMKRQDLEKLVGSDWDVELTNLFDVKTLHQLYRDLGLAVRFKNGAVSELVVAVVPLK